MNTAWLAHVLAKLPDHPAKRIDELLPWNWKGANKPKRPQPEIRQRASKHHARGLQRMRTHELAKVELRYGIGIVFMVLWLGLPSNRDSAPFEAPGARTSFTLKSPCNTGGFAAALLDRSEARRSNHPTNLIVAIGAQAQALTSAHTKADHAFSWMGEFLRLGGKQALIGCVSSSPGFSMVHFAQEKLGLSTCTLLRGIEGAFVHERGKEIWYSRTDSPGCSKGF